MFGHEIILRTKLIPPRTRRWTLARPRLYSRLDNALDYRLSILEAPTGYGKTTTLAGWLAASEKPYAWYSLGTVDSDPLVLLLHLIYAFRTRFPTAGHSALELLQRESENGELAAASLVPALRLLINDLCDLLLEESFLALDDFHLLEGRAEAVSLVDDLIAGAPPRLHLIIASRTHPALTGLPRWQAQGEVLYLTKNDLAFRTIETEQLFREQYGLELTAEQATILTSETEGWVIALQMYWQSAASNPENRRLPLGELPGNLPGLFDYLAQEVLNRQTPEVKAFLLDTSVLRRLRGDICGYLLDRPAEDCAKMLQTLSDAGLFLTPAADEASYRYHHLFSEFLYNRLQREKPGYAVELHRRAACFYQGTQRKEDAILHWLAAGDYAEACLLLESGLAEQLLATGRLERLEEWLNRFPASFLEEQPCLLIIRGDCYRLTSRFETALESYHRAASLYGQAGERLEQARALRGAAQVYIDTVQPAQAEELLEEALALINTGENRRLQGTLLRDLAENKINRGRPLEAEGLFRQARSLLNQPENAYEGVRIYLRTGRLKECLEILQQSIEDDRIGGLARAGRNHREALLLLSLINSVRGEAELAVSQAEEGIKLAQALRTPFTEAVAWQRLGHAFTTAGRYVEAQEAYHRGAAMSEKLQVRRLKAEGFMGQCALEGRPDGNLDGARRAAEEGLAIARRAGDEWIEGFIALSFAGALIQHGHAHYKEAYEVLHNARQLLEACGDRFGIIMASTWELLLHPQPEKLESLQAECQRGGFSFILERPTFFGPKDQSLLATLRGASAGQKKETGDSHNSPTGQLSILALGGFTVRRPDGSEISNRDWQREKARQLFQLLLTLRDKPLPKEQILDLLWPESDFTAADAGFKVALNALTRALEPQRPSRTSSNYILKFGSGASLSYTLNLEPECSWFDAAEFEKLVRMGRQAEQAETASTTLTLTGQHIPAKAVQYYNQAIELYRGDYLPACLYDDWAAPERERLLSLFLTTTERLAQAMAAQEDWERCLTLCRLILTRDNCWEEAYRLTMQAYQRLGNRAAALRSYERCATALSDELGIEPMPQTVALYQQILND
ncbi:MAG TPA: BTAD domain-containing putative transcriptional regulator [Chloroflexia bacterium]|nr:BTAD domain-containing putative transcriptional regulator [Chloroflexia bacterium]